MRLILFLSYPVTSFNGTRKISKYLQNKVWLKTHLICSFLFCWMNIIMISNSLETVVQSRSMLLQYRESPWLLSSEATGTNRISYRGLRARKLLSYFALPSGQSRCSSPTVNRQLEGTGEYSFLLFSVLYFPFISGNSWILWVHKITFQVFPAVYLLHGYYSEGPHRWVPFISTVFAQRCGFISTHWMEKEPKQLYVVFRVQSDGVWSPYLYLLLQVGLAFLKIHCFL